MPEGPDGKTIIIIKKVSGHGGHHGGAWKVAYADFVTAMMALFMVLWLVNSAAEPTRQRIASYFRKPGVFQKGSGTPLELGGAGILPDTFAPPADANSQLIVDKKIYEVEAETGAVRDYFDPSKGTGGPEAAAGASKSKLTPTEQKKVEEEKLAALEAQANEMKELKEKLEEALNTKEINEGGLGKVNVKVDQRGLLIEIMDTENASMFEVGSANIAEPAERQLLKIASILSQLPNPVDVEGHTDGRPFRGPLASRYDNWNLSSDRANSARRALELAGMKRQQIARVVGYADQRPKIPTDPLAPSNRRITISMRFTEQAQTALKGTQTTPTEARKLPLVESSKPVEVAPTEPKKIDAMPSTSKPDSASLQKALQEVVREPLRISTPAGKEPEVGLKVEVKTTQPEGPAATGSEPEEDGSKAGDGKKDKIFDRGNPFFE